MFFQGAHSVGLMWWMLAREVLRMRGTISREHPWEVMPDLYFYRDPEEVNPSDGERIVAFWLGFAKGVTVMQMVLCTAFP